MPRLILAAPASDCGKTTVALGTIGALRRRGLRVAAAKCGPDFIDTAHLRAAAGRTARNLDAFLASEAAVARSFERGTRDADVAIVEGVMGLFDGRHGSGEGSTAHVARVLASPVVLVLDCAKASATIGAIAFGMARFDPRVRVAGAILNRVASDAHEATLRDACRAGGVDVLGVLRRDERLAFGSRHLGLAAPGGDEWQAYVNAAAEACERGIDLDALLAVAAAAPPLAVEPPPCAAANATTSGVRPVRIAVARDEAFWFYDEGSLDAFRDAGATLVPYAPLRDPFPDVDAAIVGGGYPESYAADLERNVAARDGLRRAIEAGMPVYAECGGLMYLGRALETESSSYAMVGALPAVSTMSPKRSALRYVEVEVATTGPLFDAGAAVRGHEFHYSRTRAEHDTPAFTIGGVAEGFASANVHASYVHVHLGSYPAAVAAFVARARAFAAAKVPA